MQRLIAHALARNDWAGLAIATQRLRDAATKP